MTAQPITPSLSMEDKGSQVQTNQVKGALAQALESLLREKCPRGCYLILFRQHEWCRDVYFPVLFVGRPADEQGQQEVSDRLKRAKACYALLALKYKETDAWETQVQEGSLRLRLLFFPGSVQETALTMIQMPRELSEADGTRPKQKLAIGIIGPKLREPSSSLSQGFNVGLWQCMLAIVKGWDHSEIMWLADLPVPSNARGFDSQINFFLKEILDYAIDRDPSPPFSSPLVYLSVQYTSIATRRRLSQEAWNPLALNAIANSNQNFLECFKNNDSSPKAGDASDLEKEYKQGEGASIICFNTELNASEAEYIIKVQAQEMDTPAVLLKDPGANFIHLERLIYDNLNISGELTLQGYIPTQFIQGSVSKDGLVREAVKILKQVGETIQRSIQAAVTAAAADAEKGWLHAWSWFAGMRENIKNRHHNSSGHPLHQLSTAAMAIDDVKAGVDHARSLLTRLGITDAEIPMEYLIHLFFVAMKHNALPIWLINYICARSTQCLEFDLSDPSKIVRYMQIVKLQDGWNETEECASQYYEFCTGLAALKTEPGVEQIEIQTVKRELFLNILFKKSEYIEMSAISVLHQAIIGRVLDGKSDGKSGAIRGRFSALQKCIPRILFWGTHEVRFVLDFGLPQDLGRDELYFIPMLANSISRIHEPTTRRKSCV